MQGAPKQFAAAVRVAPHATSYPIGTSNCSFEERWVTSLAVGSFYGTAKRVRVAFDVFISFSTPDKPAADAACATLEAVGIRCWIAPRDILPGTDYAESIIDAIESAKIFVLIFSGHANASRQIKLEVERAVSKGLPIIPLRIEDIMPSKTLEYFISTPHWLDAFTPPLEAHLKQLAASVQALLAIRASRHQSIDPTKQSAPAPAADFGAASYADQAHSRRRIGLTALGIGAALIVILAVAGIWYQTARQSLVRTLTGGAQANSISFTPDGKWIAAGGWDLTIKIWDTGDGSLLRTIHEFSGHAAPFSPDGKWIAAGADDNGVRIWDAASGRVLHSFLKHTQKVQTVAFSPDGSRLVSGGEDRMLYIWEIATNELVRPLAGHTDQISSAAFSPDGKRIVSAGFDGNIMVWDVVTGQNPYFPLSSGHSKVFAAVFSPDGSSIASGGSDGSVRVWDAETGQHLREYKGDSIVDSVAFSPDGKLIAAGNNDGSVTVWDAETVRLIRKFSEHTEAVWGIGFSPDGRWIASASGDKTVKIWKTP
jgi:Tol biopolymer transport system component